METKESGVQFAYLCDPVNPLRVVTFGWRKYRETLIDYAFAVNRVVSPRDKPEVTRSTKEQRFYDPHNKEKARLIVSRRLGSKRMVRLSVDAGSSVIESIIDDFLRYAITAPRTSLPPSVRISVINGVLYRIKRSKLLGAKNAIVTVVAE